MFKQFQPLGFQGGGGLSSVMMNGAGSKIPGGFVDAFLRTGSAEEKARYKQVGAGVFLLVSFYWLGTGSIYNYFTSKYHRKYDVNMSMKCVYIAIL